MHDRRRHNSFVAPGGNTRTSEVANGSTDVDVSGVSGYVWLLSPFVTPYWEHTVIRFEVLEASEDGDFESLGEFEYDSDNFVIPEPKQLLILPDDDGEETRYFVENVAQRLEDDNAQLEIYVRNEEEVLREARQRQRQQMRQMQQLQQSNQGGGGGGGGNPFGGGGGGQGGGGDNSPFSL